MKHYGDITQIHGYDIEPVDIITGGSPCQDLSVAGKRAGLEGERSGLFMEQIRIIKEMRDATANDDIRLVRPRYCIWENVPGALSSGKPKGADFQAVLTEFVRIVEPDAPDVPLPEKGWAKSGVLMGDTWSLAYKLHDAQYWGCSSETEAHLCPYRLLRTYCPRDSVWSWTSEKCRRCRIRPS